MYGFIPAAALKFVSQLPNGQELLDEIHNRLDGVITTNFYSQYDDAETLKVVQTVADVTGLSFQDVLSNMGGVQLGQFAEKGYLPLIKSLGVTFYELLDHIDSFHINLVHSYPNMKAPSFRPEIRDDGRVFLHYYSSRPGLWPYATALLETVALELYGMTVHFEHVLKKHEGHDHDIFEIVADSDMHASDVSYSVLNSKMLTCDATVTEFNDLFPWHIQIDSTMHVVSLGTSLSKRFDIECLSEVFLTDIIKIIRPNLVQMDFEHLTSHEKTPFLMIVKDDWYYEVKRRKRLARSPPPEPATKSQRANSTSLAVPVITTNNQGDSLPSSPTKDVPPKAGLRMRLGSVGSDFSVPSMDEIPPRSCPFSGGNLLRVPEAKVAFATGGSQYGDTDEDDEEEDSPPASVGSRRNSGPARTSSSMSLQTQAFIAHNIDYLELKGEWRHERRSNTLFFVGIPAAQKPEELRQCGLGLTDIPIHSNGREMLFGSVHQSATVGVAKELEEVTQKLERARRELNSEKRKVHELLSSILPQSVITYLANSEEPPAERHNNVSVLFSDIVGFTKISSAVRPTQVMDMLNELFLEFDRLCDKHGVYKVETIGDAYMVVAGLPEACDDHAERLCRFAIDMMAASRQVASPIDGAPLKMRIGMHSGSVMAGVVGKTRPRYCLFGDTVTIAGDMESSGTPGGIQLSATMMSELRLSNANVICKPRAEIEIKGRALMQTFLLLGTDAIDQALVPADDVPNKAKVPPKPDSTSALLTMMAATHLQNSFEEDDEIETMYQVEVISSTGTVTTLVGVDRTTPLKDIAILSYEELRLPRSRVALFADASRNQLLVLSQPLMVALHSGVIQQERLSAPNENLTLEKLVLYAH
eukprot:m.20146 g.20146  ORF g.20146 m.20146 type:complete len:871 (-) comp8816_c0_seq1:54-2666(-)